MFCVLHFWICSEMQMFQVSASNTFQSNPPDKTFIIPKASVFATRFSLLEFRTQHILQCSIGQEVEVLILRFRGFDVSSCSKKDYVKQ